jgi:hypothetical protein
MTGSPEKTGFFRTLGWAVYLGCSWTWCIGMFLPVILVSEFGNAAWFVFAIPNVVGAAAMGWTLARPGSSEKIVVEHRAACTAFSAVTIAFQLFFLCWLSYGIAAMGWVPFIPISYAITAAAGGFAFGLLGRWWSGLNLLLGPIVLAISATVLACGLSHPVWGVANPIESAKLLPAMIGLSAVCLFGFGLCPYLDVTFHRARQNTSPRSAKWAFGLGFGVVFLSMIVLTLLYAGDFALDRSMDDRYGSFGIRLLITWVALHISSQIGFTISTHMAALPIFKRSDWIIWTIAGAMLAGAVIAVREEQWFSVKLPHIAMLSGDLVYRLFMSFYGLVFPAYVWICMVPLRGKAPGPSRKALVVTGVAVAIASPMYWLGFVNEQMLWLLPGVAVVLMARLFVRR